MMICTIDESRTQKGEIVLPTTTNLTLPWYRSVTSSSSSTDAAAAIPSGQYTARDNMPSSYKAKEGSASEVVPAVLPPGANLSFIIEIIDQACAIAALSANQNDDDGWLHDPREEPQPLADRF